MAIITVDDIPADVEQSVDADLLELMVDGLNAKAVRVALCLADEDPEPGLIAEAKLTLVGVVKRWVVAGSGGVQTQQQTAGVFSQSHTVDTRQRGGWNLWPSEISSLQELCKAGSSGAFSVDTAPSVGVVTGPDWWGYEVGNCPGPYLGGHP